MGKKSISKTADAATTKDRDNTTQLLMEKDLMIKRLKLRMENTTTILKIKTRKLQEAIEETEKLRFAMSALTNKSDVYMKSMKDNNEIENILNHQVFELQNQLISTEEMLDKCIMNNAVKWSTDV